MEIIYSKIQDYSTHGLPILVGDIPICFFRKKAGKKFGSLAFTLCCIFFIKGPKAFCGVFKNAKKKKHTELLLQVTLHKKKWIFPRRISIKNTLSSKFRTLCEYFHKSSVNAVLSKGKRIPVHYMWRVSRLGTVSLKCYKTTLFCMCFCRFAIGLMVPSRKSSHQTYLVWFFCA